MNLPPGPRIKCGNSIESSVVCSRRDMIDDLRLALRLLLKDRAFTLTAALTLAICIGANTALFSVVHNVLLSPLPVPESDRILLMSNSYPNAGADSLGYSGAPDYY